MKKPSGRKAFFLVFVVATGLLAVIKAVWPEWTQPFRFGSRETVHAEARADSVMQAAARADSLMFVRERPVRLIDGQGREVKHRVTSVSDFDTCFPDLNDVQLATASRLGCGVCADRAEAERRKADLVYIGLSPYYDVRPLSHSVPYLVPRAARLLDAIGRAFMDSCAVKGFPMHKMQVTSVLRTEHDVERLRRHNGNASDQSCHRYGTTFDISYNFFSRVQDPDDAPQPETWGVTLKSILSEVLEDFRQEGLCYVKFERKQSCFHITAR
ncbi:MAG: hypothetical protein J1F06_02640 [Prevotellaceae bacterium]|nr:hypothetical protein [Prevotellaceae bacterium]